MQEVKHLTLTGSTCLNDFSDPIDQDIGTHCVRVVVGDCSVTEHRRWCLPYQTGKTVHVHAKTLQMEQGQTGAGCARPCFRTAGPLGERCYENWIKTTTFL